MEKPLPHPTPTSQPFWDGLKQRRVMLQFSPAGGQWVHYPRNRAPGTLVDDLEWREVSGNGTLYTFTIGRRPTAPPWAEDVPQLIAVVELDEGPHLTSELVDVAPEDVRIGMRLRPIFHDEGEVTLLRFAPA